MLVSLIQSAIRLSFAKMELLKCPPLRAFPVHDPGVVNLLNTCSIILISLFVSAILSTRRSFLRVSFYQGLYLKDQAFP